ncbi:MAG: ADP-ribosylglycohydrolase family protein [Desulfocapsaceae bacterium]|nr:ADP-ribosylglycohydrolase family protein [Desulfocapsaceae bacterium]
MIEYKTIKNSMLWAAYGDALGFITEMCNKETLRYRTNGVSHVSSLIPWKRKIGGQYGVSVNLPAGCYSDDTQLRLAVCRSINNNGKFDFETFSKIELPVFLAYGLGVGKGTKTAGESLQKKSVQWNTNFFNTKYSQYVHAGGNGAAMRIQPHVLCSPQGSEHEIITKIMRDTIITHGHPVGWVGAVFHGLTLHYCLTHGKCPDINQWEFLASKTKQINDVCVNDPLLNNIWLPAWEREAGKKIEDGISEAVHDLIKDIKKIEQLVIDTSANSFASTEEAVNNYQLAVTALNALDSSVRGSGTKTALLATFIGHYFSKDPLIGLEICVNTLGSDTDTIATMAGALLGACTKSEPPQKVLDQEYIEDLALRLFNISNNIKVTPFPYPDLLHWGLPKSQIDFVGQLNNHLVITGLGEVTPSGEKITHNKGNNLSFLQFARTSFGQTLLLKYREKPQLLKPHLIPSRQNSEIVREEGQNIRGQNQTKSQEKQEGTHMAIKQTQSSLPFVKTTLDDTTNLLIKNGFNEAEIGKQLLKFAENNDGLEKAIAFAAIIVKAKRARLGR